MASHTETLRQVQKGPVNSRYIRLVFFTIASLLIHDGVSLSLKGYKARAAIQQSSITSKSRCLVRNHLFYRMFYLYINENFKLFFYTSYFPAPWRIGFFKRLDMGILVSFGMLF